MLAKYGVRVLAVAVSFVVSYRVLSRSMAKGPRPPPPPPLLQEELLEVDQKARDRN